MTEQKKEKETQKITAKALAEIKRINALSKTVADKIAAGEVVDRPLSVVKELMENSLDAGASSVSVEIKHGGKSYIRVTDNGVGIHRDDVTLAFMRHATSKIKAADDLDRITSLGFRGEALASIAAVSKVELITKTIHDKTGVNLKLEGGEVVEQTDVGCPEGTTIIVSDLFFNTPARLKFLKSDGTESTLIIDFISKLALAYPAVKIRLINNGNILFATTGKNDLYANILTIYSKEIGDHLISLSQVGELNGQQMEISGYISNPDYTKTNRKSQIFFVNGRYISAKLFDQAVAEGYAEKLFEGRYPLVFLFFHISPALLDVNIHPNKLEVRFADERTVKEFISGAIRKQLNTKEAIPNVKAENIFRKHEKKTPHTAPLKPLNDPASLKREYRPPAQEEQVDLKKLLEEKRKRQAIKQEEKAASSTPSQEVYEAKDNEQLVSTTDACHDVCREPMIKEMKETPEFPLLEQQPVKKYDFEISKIVPTGSIFGTYITGVDDDHFYLIDQHAAHERIFYEQLLAQYRRQETLPQDILTPLVIEVTYAVKNESDVWLRFLKNIGYQLEEFGQKAYVVKGIPMFMELSEAQDFLHDFLDQVDQGADFKDQKKIDKLITNACKKAVKAHDLLDMAEIKQLMRDLAQCDNPYSCPHGRPTFIKMSKYEIEKLFKRV